jgi:hypothetical protein
LRQEQRRAVESPLGFVEDTGEVRKTWGTPAVTSRMTSTLAAHLCRITLPVFDVTARHVANMMSRRDISVSVMSRRDNS